MKARTRLAPSPTGHLHIGTLRTGLYCYALSKNTGGHFVLRLEDTDRTRLVEGTAEKIYEVLKEYDLNPDEGPIHGGEYGPYVQSERVEIYQQHAHELVQKGKAFYCFLSPDETKKLQEQFVKENKRFRSPFRDQDLKTSLKMIEEGQKYVVRLKAPEDREIEFEDGLMGHMKFHSDEVDDTVLLKQDGYPTYHLAVAIDDTQMKITHVFRGAEWIASIPRHVLIYEAFGWKMPKHFHLPLIKDPDGGKLSKRKGATSAFEFIEEGYLPEAVLNFLMLLGWSAPIEREHGEKEKEIFTLEEFIELFDVADLNKSNPVFDREKLLWFNKQYIKNLDDADFSSTYIHWLEKFNKDSDIFDKVLSDTNLESKLSLVKERTALLSEVESSIKFFYIAPEKNEIDWNHKKLKKVKDKIEELKSEVHSFVNSMDDDAANWTHENWENGMRSIGDKLEIKHGDVFMVLRMAVVGGPFSPPLFECLQILGKEEVLERI